MRPSPYEQSGVRSRPGLTLIELIVVLVILIGLASIVIPMMSGMLTQTHSSVVATNISEISRALQVYQQLNAGYPDQWDALSDGKTLIDYLAGGAGAPNGGSSATQVGGQITASALTAEEVAALNSAGINRVHLMVPTLATGKTTANWTPTFNPYITPLPNAGTPIDTTTALAQMPGLLANQIMGAPATGKYVLLGLGLRNKMIGRNMMEPPVVFGDNASLNPANAYVRFLAVFKVSDTALTSPITAALFVGVLEPDDSGLHTINDEVAKFNQTTGN